VAKRVLTDLDFGGRKIVNLANPTNPQDAATKAYVDSVAGGGGGGGSSAGFPVVSAFPSSPFVGQTVYYNGTPFVYDGLIWRPIPESGAASYWRGVYAAFPGTITIQGRGIVLSTTGTTTAHTVANTNRIAAIPAVEALVTTASTTAVAGFRINALPFRLGGIDGAGWLYMRTVVRNATGAATPTHRAFFGLRGSSAAPTDVNPSILRDIVGLGWDSGDNNVSVIHNDETGNASKLSLGENFPRPTVNRSQAWDFTILSDGQGNVYWAVISLANGATASGVINTDLPGPNTLLTFYSYASVGGTSSVIGIGLSMVEIIQAV
jgi:hypothetical protein